MNKVNLIGRLTKDIELGYTPDQLAVGRTSLAVNDGYGENKRTYFINLKIFGKSAENMEKFTHKGSQIGITGKIATGSYEKEGRRIYTFDVIVESFDLLTYPDKKSDVREEEDVSSVFEQLNEDVPF